MLKGMTLIVPSEGEINDVISQFRDLKDEDYETIFESLILHYTISNYLDTNPDIISDDVLLVIPNFTKDLTPEGEVLDKVIQTDEIKYLIQGAVTILPEEGEMEDIMKEFRRIDTNNQYDYVFRSEIIHYTMSNYLETNSDVISDDVILVIPNGSKEATPSGEVNPDVITINEIKYLIQG